MTVQAYHFTADKLRDGRPVPAIGEKLTHEGEIEWFKSGLYASREAFDALTFAPGPYLHQVQCARIEREDKEKFVCRERTIIATIDATDLLRQLARECALDVIHLWDAPAVVREYLTTGNESLRNAAQDAAAWAKARSAAQDAAWAAAWVAARSAAWAAAQDAARSAAWAAAQDAARSAAQDAARKKQRERFNAMVDAAFDGASK